MSNYVSGANMSLVINKNESTEATVRGLNAMTLPLGFTRQTIAVSEFGVDIDTKIAAGASYDDMNASGNFVVGDTNGQDLLRQYATANTSITNMRFKLNETPGDFVTLDLANDPNGYYQVSQFSPGTANKSGVIPVTINMIAGGKSILFSKHSVTPITAVTTTTIVSDTADDWDTRFAIGDVIVIDDSTLQTNKGIFAVVTGVAATTLTFAAATFTAEASPGTTCKIHGGA